MDHSGPVAKEEMQRHVLRQHELGVLTALSVWIPRGSIMGAPCMFNLWELGAGPHSLLTDHEIWPADHSNVQFVVNTIWFTKLQYSGHWLVTLRKENDLSSCFLDYTYRNLVDYFVVQFSNNKFWLAISNKFEKTSNNPVIVMFSL